MMRTRTNVIRLRNCPGTKEGTLWENHNRVIGTRAEKGKKIEQGRILPRHPSIVEAKSLKRVMIQGYTYRELGGWLVLKPRHGKVGWGGKVQTDIDYIREIRLTHIHTPKNRDKQRTLKYLDAGTVTEASHLEC